MSKRRPNGRAKAAPPSDEGHIRSGESHIKRNSGLGIPKPAISLHKAVARDSWLSAILSHVESHIQKRAEPYCAIPSDMWTPASKRGHRRWPTIVFVIIYLRVSTRDQREDRNSLIDQLREILQSCADEGLVPRFVCWDDHTGIEYDRPGLNAAVQIVTEQKNGPTPINGIATWHMNRFGRAAISGLQKLEELALLESPLLYIQYGRLRRADVRDLNELGDAFQRLLAAQGDYEHLRERTDRGRLGAVLEGRNLGPKEWVLHETRPEKRGRKDIHPVYARADGRARWDHIRAALRSAPTSETLDALATKYGTTRKTLVTELRRRWSIGYFHVGPHESEEPFERITIGTLEEFEEVQNLLDIATARTARTRRSSTVLEAVLDSSILHVNIHSLGQIGVRCPKKTITGECGLVMQPKMLDDRHHKGKDQWVCPENHIAIVPNETVMDAIRDGTPAPCRVCHRFEYLDPSRRVRTRHGVEVITRCGRCGATNRADQETDPVRQRVMERRRPKHDIEGAYRFGVQSRIQPLVEHNRTAAPNRGDAAIVRSQRISRSTQSCLHGSVQTSYSIMAKMSNRNSSPQFPSG